MTSDYNRKNKDKAFHFPLHLLICLGGVLCMIKGFDLSEMDNLRLSMIQSFETMVVCSAEMKKI